VVRVSIIGQAAFGEAVFKRLGTDGVDVVAVSAPDPNGRRPDALWAAAEAAGVIPVATARLDEEDGQRAWRDAGADLCVMAFVTEILPLAIFSAPRLGTIQYHPSLLPAHRGASAINWAIINGDTQTGLTVFWPDEGIDTGPILLQKTCAIEPEDTVGSLYFERLFPLGVEALAEAVRLVGKGAAPRIEQDHAAASYEPPCREEHALIRWFDPAARIHALIRGCNPQPGAWTTFDDARLRLFDCRLLDERAGGMPGRVLRVDDDGFDIRLNGGVLRVLRVQMGEAAKMPAGQWAKAVGLEAGFRFR
jgi:methionyl-tRNA formyltransferase